ncbi:Thermostable carboxypeptidase 1 [Botrimarina colliarenosi]|uniref:Metal-dependent carboxypeptidase n=1 Tax=Botrimarina colliarenosi TaxID=2528001 RepID=A0A5C6AIW1_9BACT|nr:carboxypeptidase M32 [Botrimarina colliarenosi]TWT99326.1 Thermostable carboxypeptidase 1 [Botrimarina colliarenosi]
MSTAETFDKLRAHARETALVASISGLVEWDELTYLPPAGGDWRAEQQAYLAGVAHRLSTAPELGDWLAELRDSDEASDPEGDIGCCVREMSRRYDRETRLPGDLVEEIARTSSKAHHAWTDARKADNFALFLPWLEKTLHLQRQKAEAFGYGDSPYDALIEDYEPGETAASVGRVLAGLRAELAPLVQQIVGSDRTAPSELVRKSFCVDQQTAFGKAAAAKVGFDFDSGRLDVTAHPFCGGAGPRDVRMTTRYQENDFADAFFSTLHETGHGLYEQGLPADWFGLPPGEAISLGIHESQSRMWENLVGRSQGFWRHFFDPLGKAFPAAMKGVDPEAWYFAVNEARPSLIRTESDEATYNLHVIVRFELERAMIEGTLAPADLPAAWNEAYASIVGITPPSDANGCLQDVHWSAGLFGYFPTYSLGNLYAAQFFDQAEADLGDLEAMFAEGEFAPLLGWLREHIHSVGQRLSASQLVERVTGKPLSHEPLMRRLRAKFAPLYGF